MLYEAKNFEHVLGAKGFSDTMLKNHFTLYQGYVTNTNKIIDTINTIIKEGNIGTQESAELRRRFGWEFNGMRLHELYFGNMIKGGKAFNKNSKLFKKIVENFGSYENWEHEFKSVGAMRGIGWVVLYYDLFAKRLFNVWINEHDTGHLAGAVPILVMDVFEHAYITDYGIKKADYIEAFFAAIHWVQVEERYDCSI